MSDLADCLPDESYRVEVAGQAVEVTPSFERAQERAIDGFATGAPVTIRDQSGRRLRRWNTRPPARKGDHA